MNCKILGSTSGELLEKKFHVNRSIEIFLDNRSNEFFSHGTVVAADSINLLHSGDTNG